MHDRMFLNASVVSIGAPYWIGMLGDGGYGTNQTAKAVAVDESGNVYIGGGTFLVKYNESGALQWQKTFSNLDLRNITVNAGGTIFLTGTTFGSSQDISIISCNTSGSINWQRSLVGSGTNYDEGYGIALDASNNVYVVGQVNSQNAMLIAKYDSTGTLEWQRTLGSSSTTVGRDIAINNSGDIYVLGYSDKVYSRYAYVLAKYDSFGSLQWQRALHAGSSGQAFAQSLGVDASGNVYVGGQVSISNYNFQIAKYDSTGTLQWQQSLGGTGQDYLYSVAVSANGDVYVTGSTPLPGTGYTNGLIARYSSSGSIVWQRYFSHNYDSINLYDITLDVSGNVYICGDVGIGSAPAKKEFFFAKLPNDGSKTGSYNLLYETITYSASTLTSSTSSMTGITPTLANASSSITNTTTTMTNSDSSFTSTVVTI